MADIAASDVTITIQKNRIVKGSPGSLQRNVVKVAFGDGALLYPANGVALPAFSSFGLRRELEYLILIDNSDGTGLFWKYDFENKKLRAWIAPAQSHTHNLLYIGGIAETESVMIASGDTLGKNAATNRTIAGADSATKGGVVAATLAVAALTELGNVAVAAQVLYAEAVGW